MTIDDRLRSELADLVVSADIVPDDVVVGIVASGRRRKNVRRGVAGALAVLLIGVAGIAGGDKGDARRTVSADQGAGVVGTVTTAPPPGESSAPTTQSSPSATSTTSTPSGPAGQRSIVPTVSATTASPGNPTPTVTATTSRPTPPMTFADAGPLAPAGQQAARVFAGQGSIWATTTPPGNGSSDSPSTVVRVDPSDGRRLAAIPLQGGGGPLTGGFDAIWVAQFWADKVSRIDTASNRVSLTIPLELPFSVCDPCAGGPEQGKRFLPSDIASTANAIWVSTARGAVARIDPSTNEVATVVDLRANIPKGKLFGVAATTDAVWVSADLDGILRIDPTTNAVTRTIPLEHDGSQWAAGPILAEGSSVWVSAQEVVNGAAGQRKALFRIDASTGKVTLTLVDGGTLLAVGNGGTWVRQNGRLKMLHQVLGHVKIDVADIPELGTGSSTVAGSNFWFAPQNSNTITRLSSDDGTVTTTRVAAG